MNFLMVKEKNLGGFCHCISHSFELCNDADARNWIINITKLCCETKASWSKVKQQNSVVCITVDLKFFKVGI